MSKTFFAGEEAMFFVFKVFNDRLLFFLAKRQLEIAN